MRFWLSTLAIYILFLAPGIVKAQGIVSGKVFDSGTQVPMEGVSIRNMRTGGGELSDRNGFYSVNVKAGDSIEIYILGYKRFKFRVSDTGSDMIKNAYLTIEKFSLPGVEVLARRNNTKDSLANRQENASLFNYRRPSVAKVVLSSVFHPISGIQYLTDLSKNKRLKHFQTHLVNEERDRYIETRFSREDVEGITGLKGKELDDFMELYKPSFELAHESSEYDMMVYIKAKYEEYTHNRTERSAGKTADSLHSVSK